MERKRVIRLIIEDHEDVIYWDSDVDKPTLHELIVYIMDQFRKKYSTDTFSYRDFENKHYQIENIAEYEVTPIFINIPHRKDVQTFNKVDPRTYKNVYIFKDAFTVRIQKFESLNRLEEIELKLSTIKYYCVRYPSLSCRETNEKNKDLKFEDPVLSADFGKLKIEIKAPEPVLSNSASPSFGHKEPKDKQPEKAQPKQSGLLGGDKLETDISKRGNVALGEGKSQRAFMEIAQMNKNPTGKRVELQMYTIEDVKKHNRSNDAWMVINGKVYDVTQYIPFHPGGNKILMGVGKDGTELFNKYHPWVNANFLLEKYHIGFLKK